MENRVSKLEKQMKTTVKRVNQIHKMLNGHLGQSETHLKNIHAAFHDINETLVSLKDPLITVKNGKEEQKPSSEVMKENWEALRPLRNINAIHDYFQRHPVQKWFLAVGVGFSFIGVIWTIVSVPLTDLFDLLIKLVKHI